jgi:hypothetical protein
LEAEEMIVYLHMRTSDGAYDLALAPYYGVVAPYHRGVPPGEIRHVYVNERRTMPEVVAAVTRAVGHARSLWRLMINCHGEPGVIHIGQGLTVENVRAFRALRPFLTPGGSGILVGSCLAAAGAVLHGTARGCIREESSADNGLALLIELARNANTTVIGALDEQITWELNGPVLRVLPTGTYSVSLGRTERSIRPGMSESYLCPPPGSGVALSPHCG